MNIEVLGCSGGIGKGLKTTSFLVDHTLALDAGTGFEQLTMEQMLEIRYLLITHAHLDHIAGLPLMLSTIYDRHRHPIDIYALPEVIEALQRHIFNWTIWPDYTRLPEDNPIIHLHEVAVGDQLHLSDKTVEVLPAQHPTPTVGYLIADAQSSFAFSGDNGRNPDLWPLLNQHQPDMLIIDVSFTDELDELAQLSGHLTPSQLADELGHLEHPTQIMVTHLKPGFETVIMEQCHQLLPHWDIQQLEQGTVLSI